MALLVAIVLLALFRRRRPFEQNNAVAAAAESESIAATSAGAAGVPVSTGERPEMAEQESGAVRARPGGGGMLRGARAALLPVLLLIVLPAGLYVASYAFYFAAGHSWADWWEMQRQAFYFNFHLHATHTYASIAPSWILDARPVWYYFQGKTLYHGIVAMGNPLLWWSAALALIVLPALAIGDRDRRLAMPALVVALLYFPWFATTRTSFLYYMTPVAPFMAVMVATLLQRLTGERQRWPRLRAAEGPWRARR